MDLCAIGTGNTDAAYNSIPLGFPACFPPPSFAFEGNFTSEFGDKVNLDTTAGTTLQSMTVDFQSYGCGDFGHWNTAVDGDPNDPGDQADPCVTEPGGLNPDAFTIPASGTDPAGITARIYSLDGSGNPDQVIGTGTYTGSIPFRPSADDVKCVNPGTDANGGDDRGKWFDTPSGRCVNSLSVKITFPLTGTVDPGQDVIWTVSFNTSNAGANPFGNATTCRSTSGVPPVPTDPGCGYDSLNVGTYTYPGSTYAGDDLADTVWFGDPPGAANLGEESLTCPLCGPSGNNLGPADLRPLAEIVTG